MVLKTRVILKRLQRLDDHIRLLEDYRSRSMRSLVEDEITYGGVLHYLQLSAQIVLDVSAHLNAELELKPASDYRDAILNLGKQGVLPVEFAKRIAALAGFRNVLVHEYLAVDPLKVEEALEEGLDDLKAFIVYITDFLEREGYLPPA